MCLWESGGHRRDNESERSRSDSRGLAGEGHRQQQSMPSDPTLVIHGRADYVTCPFCFSNLITFIRPFAVADVTFPLQGL